VRSPSATFYVSALPSLDEGMPMTILDILPVCEHLLATPVSKVEKLLIAKQARLFALPGVVLALRKAVLRCFRSHSFAQQLGNYRQKHIQKSFSADSIAHCSLELYELVLDHQETKASISPQGVRYAFI
jgi:hypothetical protein